MVKKSEDLKKSLFFKPEQISGGYPERDGGEGRRTEIFLSNFGYSVSSLPQAPCPLLSELQRCSGDAASCAPDATSTRGKSHRHHKSANSTTFHDHRHHKSANTFHDHRHRHHKPASSTTIHHQRHNKAAARETAMLLPGKYSQQRLHEGEYEVRANLKMFVPKEENTGRKEREDWALVT